MARPYTYSAEYIKQVEGYLAMSQDVYDTVTNKLLRVRIPSIEAFARFIGVHKDTVYEWEKQQPEFSDALELIRLEQRERLMNHGLFGTYNATIAKLMLSANHNMKERVDTTTNDKELPTPILAMPHVQPDNSNQESSGPK